MGIDYSGGMIVGCEGLPPEPDDWDEDEHGEWREHLLCEIEMERYAQWYDAGDDDCYFGFPVKDVLVKDFDSGWLKEVNELAFKFKTITGEDAYLIGSQDIY